MRSTNATTTFTVPADGKIDVTAAGAPLFDRRFGVIQRPLAPTVLVHGTSMPQPEELPEALAALARRNAIELSDTRWAYDVGRLNLGAVPTTQVSWNQPHEGNLFEHLYARRAFQRAAAV